MRYPGKYFTIISTSAKITKITATGRIDTGDYLTTQKLMDAYHRLQLQEQPIVAIPPVRQDWPDYTWIERHIMQALAIPREWLGNFND